MIDRGQTAVTGQIGMFDCPELLREIRGVCPTLRTYPSVNVWQMGCGTGERAFATAIVLREEGVLDRCRIYATDERADLIARAREAQVPLDVSEVEARRYAAAGGRASLAEYVRREGRACFLRPELVQHVFFAHHNLETDGSLNEFQLVVCIDVLPGRPVPVVQKILRLIDSSLCPLGLLALGPADAPFLRSQMHRYRPLGGGLHRRVQP